MRAVFYDEMEELPDSTSDLAFAIYLIVTAA